MSRRRYKSQPPNNTGKTYNKTVFDPRVDMFKQFYLSPASYTFMNIRQSALRAGYSEQYANNISTQAPKWWVELVESKDYRRAQMLQKAENRLQERLIEEASDDTGKLKIQTDVAKYVTERLGKDAYSTRQEVTGADGRQLFSTKERESKQVPLKSLFKGVSKS